MSEVFRQNQLFIPNWSTFQWIIFIFLNITDDINDLTRKKNASQIDDQHTNVSDFSLLRCGSARN